ncbi:MAG: hypothetical protein ACE37J_11845 [Pikeienuella sp.]|uniref:hypothetical protein n=1 Tax=Pikeienuella sp. TaxID=2831957 RepID=UPI00391B9934
MSDPTERMGPIFAAFVSARTGPAQNLDPETVVELIRIAETTGALNRLADAADRLAAAFERVAALVERAADDDDARARAPFRDDLAGGPRR